MYWPGFMFATGIENSAPTLDGGRVRVDEMETCGHYTHWHTDFTLVEELDIHFLRYGPPCTAPFWALTITTGHLLTPPLVIYGSVTLSRL